MCGMYIQYIIQILCGYRYTAYIASRSTHNIFYFFYRYCIINIKHILYIEANIT